MSFPRYPEYKPSGVEWLGEVPAHWDAGPLKHVIASIESGTSVNAIDEPATNGQVGVLKTSCVYSNRFRIEENKTVVEDELDRVSCQLRVDTLIVSRMNTPDLVGAAGHVERAKAGIYLPDRLWQVELRNALPSFVHYWTQSVLYRASVKVACSGTSSSMQNLGQDQFKSFPIGVPSLAEQSAIANFLDRETAKIDALMAEQEKLIVLLKEKRQALISHAVTKGLNPDAPMKDSGVEWLGQVPAHWEVMPLKRDLAFITSGSRGWAEHYADDGELFIRIGNLTRETLGLDLSDIQRVDVPGRAEGERTIVRPGDLLFSITAYLGSVAVVPGGIEKAYVSQHVALARLIGKKLSPRWVGYIVLSFVGKTYLDEQAYGGTKIQLGLDDVANLVCVVPPLNEQKAIVSFLDSETAKTHDLVEEAEHAIGLLKERRSALISAAVTGKIDVRGLVSHGVIGA